MGKTSRYPTRSSVNRAQNSGGTSSIPNNNNNLPERRSERTRSQTDRLGTATSQPSSRDYSRMHHQPHGHPQPNHAHTHLAYQQANHHQMQSIRHPMVPNDQPMGSIGQHMVPNRKPISVPHNITSTTRTSMSNAPQNFPAVNYHNPSMPKIVDITNGGIKFISLNSFDDVSTLIHPCNIATMSPSMSQFQVNQNKLQEYLLNAEYRIFLRFCKFSSTLAEQNDCLPKSFNLMINQAAFQVKNKYTFAPYDITTRIACEKSNDIAIRVSVDPNSNEKNEEFSYGLYVVKKVDHNKLIADFKIKEPANPQISLDLVKKKLNPDDDSDDIAIIENADQIKVSLLCPLSSTRIKYPARSKHCDHVLCFDAESFISLNEITPRWKCPICKIYIKLSDMIKDGLMCNILRNAPADCLEAEILADGKIIYSSSNAKSSSANSPQSENANNDSTSEKSNKRNIKAESDSEIEIIFEKLVTKNPASNTSQANRSNFNSNSSSSGTPCINNQQFLPSSSSMPQFNSSMFNSHCSMPFTAQSSNHYNNRQSSANSSVSETINNVNLNMHANPNFDPNSPSASGFGMNEIMGNNSFMASHGNMYSVPGTSNASSYSMPTCPLSTSPGHSRYNQNTYSSSNTSHTDSTLPPGQFYRPGSHFS